MLGLGRAAVVELCCPFAGRPVLSSAVSPSPARQTLDGNRAVRFGIACCNRCELFHFMYKIWKHLNLLKINIVESHLAEVKFPVKQGLLEYATGPYPGEVGVFFRGRLVSAPTFVARRAPLHEQFCPREGTGRDPPSPTPSEPQPFSRASGCLTERTV